jgi:hypothetical protein
MVIVAPVKQSTSSAWAFFKPFTLEMWCVTGALFVFVGIVVWILEHRTNEEFRGTPQQQVLTIFWYVLIAIIDVFYRMIISSSECRPQILVMQENASFFS